MELGRREILTKSLVVVAGAAIAEGCSSSSTSSNSTAPKETPDKSVAPKETSTPNGNPFETAHKGVALSNSLLYAPGQDTEPMSAKDLDKRMQLIVGLGATSIRFGVDATVLWANEDDFNADRITWDQYELLAETAGKYGLDSVPNFIGWPVPFGEADCSDSFSCLPADKYWKKYASLVSEFVGHFPEYKKYLVWNEESSIAANGGSPQNPKYFADPEQFAAFYNMVQESIKNAKSDAAVAVGPFSGLATAGAMDPAEYLRRAIHAGMTGFSAISINNYGDTGGYITGGPDTLAAVLNNPALNRRIPGLDGTPILMAEFGAAASDPSLYQAQIEAVRNGLATKFGDIITARYVYTLEDGANDANGYGLYTADLTPKPAAKTFRDTPLGSA